MDCAVDGRRPQVSPLDMTYGIVVAGGQGTRIGFRKQYVLLADVPMWARSTHALLAGGAQRVFIVVPEDDVTDIAASLVKETWGKQCDVVAGGLTRSQSVRNGLCAIISHLETLPATPRHPECAEVNESLQSFIVLIHDAARPFVNERDVRAVAEEARSCGAAILASPCQDTVKSVLSGSEIAATVPREQLWLAQTPQGFRMDLLLDAYQKWYNPNAPTDDAAVMEAAGYPVRVVSSTSMNIKVTTPDDLAYAAWQAERIWGAAFNRGERE